jgi:DNA primase
MRWHEASRRVLIPVWRYRRLIAVVGRSVHGERPKYRMLGGDPGTLYRLPQRPVRAVVVVEDILSAIAVWRAGANALAVLGTHVSTTQAAQIADGADTVVSWFDSDAAGQKAHAKLRSALSLYPVKLQRIQTQQDPKLLPRATLRDLVAPFIGG